MGGDSNCGSIGGKTLEGGLPVGARGARRPSPAAIICGSMLEYSGLTATREPEIILRQNESNVGPGAGRCSSHVEDRPV